MISLQGEHSLDDIVPPWAQLVPPLNLTTEHPSTPEQTRLHKPFVTCTCEQTCSCASEPIVDIMYRAVPRCHCRQQQRAPRVPSSSWTRSVPTCCTQTHLCRSTAVVATLDSVTKRFLLSHPYPPNIATDSLLHISLSAAAAQNSQHTLHKPYVNLHSQPCAVGMHACAMRMKVPLCLMVSWGIR